MSFRIFGDVLASMSNDRRNRLRELLVGPHGLGALIDLFAKQIHHLAGRCFTRSRSIGALCNALLAACCHGLMHEVVQQGICPLLAALIEDL